MLAQVLLFGQQDVEGNFAVEMQTDFLVLSAHDRASNREWRLGVPATMPEMERALDLIMQIGHRRIGVNVAQTGYGNVQHFVSLFSNKQPGTLQGWIVDTMKFAPVIIGGATGGLGHGGGSVGGRLNWQRKKLSNMLQETFNSGILQCKAFG